MSGAPTLSGTVLVVDDDDAVRRTCVRLLERLGHRTAAAGSAEEARARMAAAPPDVLLTDLQMPGVSGLALLAEVRARWPATRCILMSGRADVSDAAVAVRHGVDRILLKPLDLDELRTAVGDAVAARRTHDRAARDREAVEGMARQRAAESRLWVLRAAHALAAAVEARDAYTAGHAARVTAYALTLAEAVGGIDLDAFRLANQLHDVGKIGVPDAVLNKPGPLTPDEAALVRRHPGTGRRILEPLIDDPLVIAVVRWHHERWDGGGYPDGLRGDQIPLPARITAIADTLDAITSSRAYRAGLPWDTAVAEVRGGAGTQFDPRLVAGFESVLPALAAHHAAFVASSTASPPGAGG